jgi:hypothetical protein
MPAKRNLIRPMPRGEVDCYTQLAQGLGIKLD